MENSRSGVLLALSQFSLLHIGRKPEADAGYCFPDFFCGLAVMQQIP
jgi:hypothetical protein